MAAGPGAALLALVRQCLGRWLKTYGMQHQIPAQPWEASVGRASNATCPECEQRAMAQPGGRGCGDPTLTPRRTALGKLVVYADGLEGSLTFQGTA